MWGMSRGKDKDHAPWKGQQSDWSDEARAPASQLVEDGPGFFVLPGASVIPDATRFGLGCCPLRKRTT
jgi:hypothetical protein